MISGDTLVGCRREVKALVKAVFSVFCLVLASDKIGLLSPRWVKVAARS